MLGVDLSVILHQVIHKDLPALCLNLVSQYPPDEVLMELHHRHNLIILKDSITPYYVFDGKQHPMKYVAQQQCSKVVEKANNSLIAIYDKA